MQAHISWCCTFLKLEKGTSYREEIEYYHYNCPCSQKGVCVAFPLVWLMLIESFKNQVTLTCMLQDTSFLKRPCAPLFSNLKTFSAALEF